MVSSRLEVVSNYLLDLYEHCACTAPDPYASVALDGLQDLVGAKRAWWGILAKSDNGPKLNGSFRSGLPPAWETIWETVKNDDSLVPKLIRHPNRMFGLNSSTIPHGSGLIQLAEEFDIRETIVSSVHIPEQNSFMFVSLYRGHHEELFSPEDRLVGQLLTSHLYLAWRQNLNEACRSDHPSRVYRAFINREGLLIRYDQGLIGFLQRRWRAWNGRSLPLLLREAVRRSYEANGLLVKQDGWSIKAAPAGLMISLELREYGPLDALTERERQVAELYADGASHKEISAAVGLRPSTVRYYLREAYSKLNIDNKASLARLFSSQHVN